MPLLTFLNLQDQVQLGFNSVEQLKRISEINLKGAQPHIMRNAILVNPKNHPKVYF